MAAGWGRIAKAPFTMMHLVRCFHENHGIFLIDKPNSGAPTSSSNYKIMSGINTNWYL